jgi:hypothetical protein
MVVVNLNEKIFSNTPRQKIGIPSYFGERIFGQSHFGQEYMELSQHQFGQKRFGLSFYGDNLTFDGVFHSRHRPAGLIYVREKYYWPKPARNEAQNISRNKFADAVTAYQALSTSQKAGYKLQCRYKKFTGYNLFLSEYLKSH